MHIPALLHQTQGCTLHLSSLRSRGPGSRPLPSDPGVHIPALLPSSDPILGSHHSRAPVIACGLWVASYITGQYGLTAAKVPVVIIARDRYFRRVWEKRMTDSETGRIQNWGQVSSIGDERSVSHNKLGLAGHTVYALTSVDPTWEVIWISAQVRPRKQL